MGPSRGMAKKKKKKEAGKESEYWWNMAWEGVLATCYALPIEGVREELRGWRREKEFFPSCFSVLVRVTPTMFLQFTGSRLFLEEQQNNLFQPH